MDTFKTLQYCKMNNWRLRGRERDLEEDLGIRIYRKWWITLSEEIIKHWRRKEALKDLCSHCSVFRFVAVFVVLMNMMNQYTFNTYARSHKRNQCTRIYYIFIYSYSNFFERNANEEAILLTILVTVRFKLKQILYSKALCPLFSVLLALDSFIWLCDILRKLCLPISLLNHCRFYYCFRSANYIILVTP